MTNTFSRIGRVLSLLSVGRVKYTDPAQFSRCGSTGGQSARPGRTKHQRPAHSRAGQAGPGWRRTSSRRSRRTPPPPRYLRSAPGSAHRTAQSCRGRPAHRWRRLLIRLNWIFMASCFRRCVALAPLCPGAGCSTVANACRKPARIPGAESVSVPSRSKSAVENRQGAEAPSLGHSVWFRPGREPAGRALRQRESGPNVQEGLRFHPLFAFVDHGADGSGEPAAVMLRPGNAGANTAADHKQGANGSP